MTKFKERVRRYLRETTRDLHFPGRSDWPVSMGQSCREVLNPSRYRGEGAGSASPCSLFSDVRVRPLARMGLESNLWASFFGVADVGLDLVSVAYKPVLGLVLFH